MPDEWVRSASQARFTSIADYEYAARQRIPEMLWRTGQLDSLTNQSNQAAFQRIELRPRVMIDVSNRSLTTSVLGKELSLPVLVCPMGGLARFNTQGELAVARAVGAAGTLMTLAMGSAFSLEEVASNASGPLWNQIMVLKDRPLTEELVKRTQAAGYRALVLTVDFVGHSGRVHWGALSEAAGYVGMQSWPNFAGVPNRSSMNRWDDVLALDFTWSDLEWLRSLTSLPLVLKGIQTAEDAQLSVLHGVDGIWVSNHGGEGLPGALPPITVLSEVLDAVGDRAEVYMDSGVRTGVDVLKALALGAKAACVGRPVLWGLTVGGEAGTRDVLEILREELFMAMGLCGVTDVKRVGANVVRSQGGGSLGTAWPRPLA
jgi:4-hydroxymandelate oxidase